jgi:hypothetical protein
MLAFTPAEFSAHDEVDELLATIAVTVQAPEKLDHLDRLGMR